MKQCSAYRDQSPSQRAFTLIELLIAMSIMAILFTIGIAKYNDFNRRQIVTQAALELNSYRFYGICDNTEFYDNESPKSKEINLASKKITISSTRQMPSVIRFKPLGHGSEHGLEDSTTITLTYLGSGFSQQVIVSKTGEIK